MLVGEAEWRQRPLRWQPEQGHETKPAGFLVTNCLRSALGLCLCCKLDLQISFYSSMPPPGMGLIYESIGNLIQPAPKSEVLIIRSARASPLISRAARQTYYRGNAAMSM